ncbi:MAG: hypothetical protein P8186_29640, partial [Anaerolineae bacterium]
MKSNSILAEAKLQMIFTLSIAFIAILLLVGGQTLLKMGQNLVGGVRRFRGEPMGRLRGLFPHQSFIVGVACYGIT